MLPFDELVLHKYRIRRAEGRRDGLLGRGTFGSVYLAHEELADRDVAIKELQVDASELGAEQEEALRRFLTEGRLGLRVRHPNILEVYAIEPYEDGYLLVMELAESGDLKGALQQGRPDLERAVRIGIGIARGLQAAHERGIVHRDLKPGNVFLMEDGTPKVADFGVAHIPEAMGGYLSMTRTGFQPGTVIYMSPEQAQGRRADHRSDLYSLAVILFELLTGSFYVDIDRCSELARNRARIAPALSELHFVWAFTEVAFAGPLPRPSERNPAIPAWLDDVMLRGLARDPAHRFQSGREFAEALASGPLPSGAVVDFPYDATLVDRPAPVRAPVEPVAVDLYTPRGARPAPGAAAAQPAPAEEEPVLYAAPPTWVRPSPRSDEPERAGVTGFAGTSPQDAQPASGDGGGSPPAEDRAAAAAGGGASRQSGAAGETAAGAPLAKGRGRLWLLALAALLLLGAGGAAGFALAQRSPSRPVATPAAGAAAAPGASAASTASSATPAAGTAAATAGAAGTATSPARAQGTVTPAGAVDVAALLRPGASVVKHAPVAGAAAGDAGQLVVHSQAAGSDGCEQPYLDVFRPDAGGNWASAWDATRQPADRPLLPAAKRSGERCFPAVEFFDVRPLANGGAQHAVASIVLDADGRRRLIDLSLADATKPIALDFDLTTTPAAAPPEFTEGLPQSLRVSQNAYPAQASGVNGGYGRPIGTLDSLLRWDEAAQAFKPISQQLTLNCTRGVIAALGRAAVQVRCDDGRYSAVAVDGNTNYGSGASFTELRTGDTVGFSVAPASLSPADPLNALPTATAVLRER